MTVRELIKELELLNPNDCVFVKGDKCLNWVYNVVTSSDADYKEVYIETFDTILKPKKTRE